jgi:hypothetical protein
MTPKSRIPVEYIHERIEYREEVVDGILQGNLYWKHYESGSNNWNSRCAGKKVGARDDKGYCVTNITYNNIVYQLKAHVITWIINHGSYPDSILDHKDRNKSNNLISNLRKADSYTNSINVSKKKNARSQYMCVTYIDDCPLRPWRCAIGKSDSTGKYKIVVRNCFEDELEAALFYNETVVQHHPKDYITFNDISNGYTNKEYPNKPRGWKPE